MNIFEFTDYKVYVNAWITSLPKKGRGEYKRLSEKLNVSSTMISQVFGGDKHLSLELASDLSDYLSLNQSETDYFFTLVEHGRAGSFRLQQKLKAKIESAQLEAKKLESRMKTELELSDANRAVFYSSWIYSGVRMLSALSAIHDSKDLAGRLNMPLPQLQKVIEFLLNEQLLIEKDGSLEVGPRYTFISADSPFVPKHHQNWRLHGFQRMTPRHTDNFFYTGPMSLSQAVADQVRAELPAFVDKIVKWVGPSESEVVRCLNIDWFEF